jgi:hypothetical protein
MPCCITVTIMAPVAILLGPGSLSGGLVSFPWDIQALSLTGEPGPPPTLVRAPALWSILSPHPTWPGDTTCHLGHPLTWFPSHHLLLGFLHLLGHCFSASLAGSFSAPQLLNTGSSRASPGTPSLPYLPFFCGKNTISKELREQTISDIQDEDKSGHKACGT